MDPAILTEYVSPLILVACLVVGFLVKSCGKDYKVNQYIPLIVAVCGMIFNVWLVGVFDLVTLVTGAVSGLASCGAYDAIDNLIELYGKKETTEEGK